MPQRPRSREEKQAQKADRLPGVTAAAAAEPGLSPAAAVGPRRTPLAPRCLVPGRPQDEPESLSLQPDTWLTEG